MTYGRLVGKKERLYLPVGAGDALKYGITGGAALLDIARRAGLNVPAAIILIDEAYRRALESGMIRAEPDGAISVPDTTRLAFALALPNFDWEFPGPFTICTAFSDPIGVEAGLAPATPITVIRDQVDGRDSVQLSEALCAAWGAVAHPTGAFRRDVLIMRAVNTVTGGVAFTEGDFPHDLIQLTQAPQALHGEGPYTAFEVPKRRAGEGPKRGATWQERVQTLLHRVRTVFAHRRSGRNWEIAWADDGEQCWLVGVRPLHTPSQRNEAFLDGLRAAFGPGGIAHSPLLTSLITACGAEVWAALRELDRALPESRRLMEVHFGRPYLNVSLLADMLRLWGLPATQLAAPLRAALGEDFPAVAGRAVRKLIPARRLKALHTAPPRADTTTTTTFGGALGAIRAAYTAAAFGWVQSEQGEPSGAVSADAAREAMAALQRLADSAAQEGRLPKPDQVWLLQPDEAQALDQGATYPPEFFAQRAPEWAQMAALSAPESFRRGARTSPPQPPSP